MPCFVAGHDYREIAEQNAVGVAKGQNSLGTDITFLLLLFAEKVAICRDKGHIRLFLSYLESRTSEKYFNILKEERV